MKVPLSLDEQARLAEVYGAVERMLSFSILAECRFHAKNLEFFVASNSRCAILFVHSLLLMLGSWVRVLQALL
jgi:hypothetical protein